MDSYASVDYTFTYNIFTDFNYTQKHLVYLKRSPSTNAVLISSARTLLDEVRASVHVAIVWTKARTELLSTAARGKKRADQLALQGRQELSMSVSGTLASSPSEA